jgi:stage III sporulation protein AG
VGKLWQWLADAASGGPGGADRLKSLRWLLVLGLIGAALMILNSFLQVKEPEPEEQSAAFSPPEREAFGGGGGGDRSKFRDYEQAYESRMRDILQNIVGVGEVEVMVTIDSTEEMYVEKNTKDTQQVTGEKDTNGATRNITEVTRSGEVVLYQVSGGQQPLVLKYIKPKIRGVVVVARGAENVTVKRMITEAVERGLDVPPHRISVLPRKQ